MTSEELKALMRKWTEKNWGKRCKEYAKDCGECEAWKAFDYLFEYV